MSEDQRSWEVFKTWSVADPQEIPDVRTMKLFLERQDVPFEEHDVARRFKTTFRKGDITQDDHGQWNILNDAGRKLSTKEQRLVLEDGQPKAFYSKAEAQRSWMDFRFEGSVLSTETMHELLRKVGYEGLETDAIQGIFKNTFRREDIVMEESEVVCKPVILLEVGLQRTQIMARIMKQVQPVVPEDEEELRELFALTIRDTIVLKRGAWALESKHPHKNPMEVNELYPPVGMRHLPQEHRLRLVSPSPLRGKRRSSVWRHPVQRKRHRSLQEVREESHKSGVDSTIFEETSNEKDIESNEGEIIRSETDVTSTKAPTNKQRQTIVFEAGQVKTYTNGETWATWNGRKSSAMPSHDERRKLLEQVGSDGVWNREGTLSRFKRTFREQDVVKESGQWKMVNNVFTLKERQTKVEAMLTLLEEAGSESPNGEENIEEMFRETFDADLVLRQGLWRIVDRSPRHNRRKRTHPSDACTESSDPSDVTLLSSRKHRKGNTDNRNNGSSEDSAAFCTTPEQEPVDALDRSGSKNLLHYLLEQQPSSGNDESVFCVEERNESDDENLGEPTVNEILDTPTASSSLPSPRQGFEGTENSNSDGIGGSGDPENLPTQKDEKALKATSKDEVFEKPAASFSPQPSQLDKAGTCNPDCINGCGDTESLATRKDEKALKSTNDEVLVEPGGSISAQLNHQNPYIAPQVVQDNEDSTDDEIIPPNEADAFAPEEELLLQQEDNEGPKGGFFRGVIHGFCCFLRNDNHTLPFSILTSVFCCLALDAMNNMVLFDKPYDSEHSAMVALFAFLYGGSAHFFYKRLDEEIGGKNVVAVVIKVVVESVFWHCVLLEAANYFQIGQGIYPLLGSTGWMEHLAFVTRFYNFWCIPPKHRLSLLLWTNVGIALWIVSIFCMCQFLVNVLD